MSFAGGPIRHLGRYEVIGLLATGGMAEVHLGRLMGPSGFERVVVLKRILPHLAREPQFVDMFLDEARIAARIRHGNVVQVTDLGRDGDELYLTMDYVEGESLGSLMRRHWTTKRAVGHELAAFIVAQACAGLHAAHQLTDEDGRPLEIVHRDVSPQNLMVTYDGQVKVLDFGIAKAVDRATRTTTGQLKGKVEYMSPEQVRTEPVDRRSDVFSLGILLYELVLGVRLFRRGGELAALRAVSEAPIAAPVEVDPDVPETLSRICMRALERNREARFASADEMRRELLSYLSASDRAGLHADLLAERMGELFQDRQRHKQDLLRNLRAGRTPPEHLPSAEVDLGAVQPVVEPATDSLPPPPSASAQATTIVAGPPSSLRRENLPPPSPSRRLVAFGLAGTVVAAGALLAAERWATRGPPDPTEAPRSAAPLPETVAPNPEVTIEIQSTPAGAEVHIGGEKRGTTPLKLTLPRTQQEIAVKLQLDGHEPLLEAIRPDVDQRLSLTLRAAPKGQPALRTPSKPVRPAPSGSPYRKFN